MSAIMARHEAISGHEARAMSAMKVLHVIPGIAPRYGGPSLAVLEICRRLAASGTEPLIASTDADGKGRLPVTLEQPVDYQGVPTIFFRRQWSEAFKYSRPLAKWLSGCVADFDAVHIHAIYSHASIAAAAAARRAGVPYVVRPLGSLNPWARRHKPARKFVFWHAGVRRMLRGAAAIHYTSLAEQQQAEAALDLPRGVVIPLGIDIAAAEGGATDTSRQNDQGDYVLALGRLHPVKGLDLLIDVFVDVVRREQLSWKLKLVGDGSPDYVESLKRRVRQRSAEDLVEFAGWLDGSDKESVLRGASLLAMPSHQENFGLSMFEALGRGIPVLVSDRIDWAGEVAAAGAGWQSALDRRCLGEALASALASRTERTARGKAGERLVRARFAWPVITTRLEQLYQEIASARGGR
ncbi:MAG TPA: glycosyltransferase [Pirellulales bacterium]|nr:glycosyltransferase [Pirellulales bacterium]